MIGTFILISIWPNWNNIFTNPTIFCPYQGVTFLPRFRWYYVIYSVHGLTGLGQNPELLPKIAMASNIIVACSLFLTFLLSLIVEKTDGTVFSLLNMGVMATKTPGLQSGLCQADKRPVTVRKKLIHLEWQRCSGLQARSHNSQSKMYLHFSKQGRWSWG